MTDRYAVIGNPIAHSRSPFIHARFAAQTGQDLVYDRLLAPLDGFAAAVQASFNDVNKAQQDKESMINVANGEYNKVVPRARGVAEQLKSEAEGYKLKRVNEALGDVASFKAQLAQYTKSPVVTRTRLYLETMKEVLPSLAGKWIVDKGVTQLLPMLPAAGQEVRK